MNYLHVELPSLHLVWKRAGQQDVVCSVIRTNYPKPSPLLVSAIMRQVEGVEVRAVDMKIRGQDTIVPYREFDFECGNMTASRMGMRFEAIADQVRWADVIGLTINPSSWANIAIDFLKFAKRVNPRVKIVVGGTDPTFRPDFYLHHSFDFVVRGEGEVAGPRLLKFIASGQYAASVRKDEFVRVHGITSIATDEADADFERNCNLDDEPLPALDLFVGDMPLWTTPIEGYVGPEVRAPIAWIYITRGCNQSCEFCTTPQKYGRLRFKSLSRVEAELKRFQKFGIGTINIWDDSLSSLVGRGQRDLLVEYIRMIRRYGFSFEYAQGMVIRDLWDNVKNEPDFELIQALYGHEIVDGKFVGCYGQYMPFEFLQEEDTTAQNCKLLSYEKELLVLRAILVAGVKYLSYSCIVGRSDDGERQFQLAEARMQQIQGIIESAGANGLATPFVYSIFPGARLWCREASRVNYVIEEFPELYQLNAAPHGTNVLSSRELMIAKLDLERRLLGEERFARWITTGRYQW